jgi:hypothetical protein
MTGRRAGRVQRCGDADARRRLEQARQFLDVAEVAAEGQKDDGGLEYGNAAATLAVLAGIAAADAACCKALGGRSRADDHRQAEVLVEQIAPGGQEAAKRLRGLIALKSNAQYGFHGVGRSELVRALRQARGMVAFAQRVFRT